MWAKKYYVYILTNKRNNVFYVGVTSTLQHRVWEHKNKVHAGFTAKYNINKLVYYEEYQYVEDAIYREKQLKKWRRQWKVDLIKKSNPYWNDLAADWPSSCHPELDSGSHSKPATDKRDAGSRSGMTKKKRHNRGTKPFG